MSSFVSVIAKFFCIIIFVAGCGGGTIGSSTGDTGGNRSIQGYARTSTQAPISEATIVMSNGEGQSQLSTTNSDGSFEMLAPEGSDYSIEFQPDQAQSRILTLRYKAQLASDSVIKLTIKEQQKEKYDAKFSEADITLGNCTTYIVENRQIVRVEDSSTLDCQAIIQFVSPSKEPKQFGLYATCQGKEKLIFEKSIQNEQVILPLTVKNDCVLSKIQEISSNDPSKITFPIVDR